MNKLIQEDIKRAIGLVSPIANDWLMQHWAAIRRRAIVFVRKSVYFFLFLF